MKKRLLIIILFAMFLYIPSVSAALDAIINNSSVRIRTGAGTSYSIIATVNKGTSIEVVDKTLYEGSGCSSKWYKVIYKEKQGYVCSQYVTFVDNTYSGINVSDWTARVSGNNVAVRKGAGTNYGVIERLTLGANVTWVEVRTEAAVTAAAKSAGAVDRALTELVVLSPLIGVGQNGVSLVYVLKFLLSGLITRI